MDSSSSEADVGQVNPRAWGCREEAASESNYPGSQWLLFQLKQLLATRNTADEGIQTYIVKSTISELA